MSLIVISPPGSEPVTLAAARAQARIDHVVDDPSLAGYLMAARELCEHELQRTLIATTYELNLDAFPDGTIELPMGPFPAVGALTVSSVKYTDLAAVEQTVSSALYEVDGYSLIPRLVPLSGWPSPKVMTNAVRVRYVSGHVDASLIPQAIKTWIVLHVAHLSENREAAVEKTLQPLPFLGRLLDPYRSFR